MPGPGRGFGGRGRFGGPGRAGPGFGRGPRFGRGLGPLGAVMRCLTCFLYPYLPVRVAFFCFARVCGLKSESHVLRAGGLLHYEYE